jgi:RNA polymerase sigma-70 factor (ECF subfamily)
MFGKSSVLVLSVMFFTAGSAALAADTASQLLEKGIYSEETVGDLQAAIDLYQKAVAEAKNDEACAAEAQYRMGQCLSKQKKTDKAVAAFQKVIDSYPDQEQWVVKAKQHVPALLKYDDGGMESETSIAGGGHAVLFKCPSQGDWYLDQVQLFGTRYGYPKAPNENFYIYITDPKMEKVCKIAKPYGTFARGKEKWTTIKITPVKVPEEFYICFVFDPTDTKGVFVGMDENVEVSHSKNAVPGDHISDMSKKADWMIRAHVTPYASPKPLQLAGLNDQENAQESAAAPPPASIGSRPGNRVAGAGRWNLAPPPMDLLPADARELIDKYEQQKKPILRETQQKIRRLQLPLIDSLKQLLDRYTRESKLDEAIAVRDWIKHLQMLADNVFPDPGAPANCNPKIGDEFNFRVTGNTNGTVWGTDVYTTDSILAAAAVHAGMLDAGETGIVKVTIIPGQMHYEGSERNGVSSSSYGSFPASYKIEHGVDGLEEKIEKSKDFD